MNRVLIVMFMLLCAAALSNVAFAAPNMHPGRWEITSTIDMPGMAFTMPASTHTQCITAKDLIPQAQQENDKCKILENQISGDTVTWKVRCESDGGTMVSEGRIVYDGDSFAGTVATTGSQMPSGMTQKMTGKRLGECQ